MADNNLEKFTSQNPLQRFFIRRFYLALENQISQILPINTILDAGCGEGFTTRTLKASFPESSTTGVDQDKDAIRFAKEKDPASTYSLGDVTSLQFENNKFDLVICNEVLEHLPQPEKAIQELLRVTKTYLIISVPHEPYFRISNLLRGRNILRFGNYPYHLHTWSKRQICNLLNSFCNVERVATPFPWTLITCRKR